MIRVAIDSKSPYLEEALQGIAEIVSKEKSNITIKDSAKKITIISGDTESTLAKPIRLTELITLINSGNTTYKLGEYEFSPLHRKITGKDSDLSLTEKESDILKYLITKTEVDKTKLLQEIWGYSEGSETKTVETHIYRLRQKLATLGLEELIETSENSYRLNQ